MSSVELGPVGEGDLDEVIAIERDCFPNPWPRSAFDLALAAGELLFLGARVDGHTCGYVVAAHFGDEVLVANLAVARAWRRHGMASALLAAVIDWGRVAGARRCRLHVRESNAGARALYERYGFVRVGRVRRYYSDPTEDALYMGMELPSRGAAPSAS